MECHIESNYLLLWIDETTNVVRLLRLGTHSEVLGM
ncbi:MAG: type II toxin-antitoxin system YafQ family toxin [Prevotella sp.]|nr:type II toxin-antitoxin system YafQ family toxin [Prevotella sp.]